MGFKTLCHHQELLPSKRNRKTPSYHLRSPAHFPSQLNERKIFTRDHKTLTKHIPDMSYGSYLSETKFLQVKKRGAIEDCKKEENKNLQEKLNRRVICRPKPRH